VMRRDPESGLTAPVLPALKVLSIPVLLTIVAVEWEFLQGLLMTTSLTGGQWLACLGLALLVPLVVEVDKALRRRSESAPPPMAAQEAVAPVRAR